MQSAELESAGKLRRLNMERERTLEKTRSQWERAVGSGSASDNAANPESVQTQATPLLCGISATEPRGCVPYLLSPVKIQIIDRGKEKAR